MKKRILLILLVIALLLFTYGCKKEEKQAVAKEITGEAISIKTVEAAPEDIKIVDGKAESILNGLNSGDYALFSTDFSDTARQSFDEAYFNKLRKFVKDNSGDYVAKAIAMSKGSIFTYDCQFSKESVLLGLVLNSDLSKVESLYLDSANMREILSHQLDFAK
ncbi:MAG: hypothetical protein QME12_03335 [Nanoarchaeota archaeon]|nr:hypothetical protein [Nanoarchaeota archaeon]